MRRNTRWSRLNPNYVYDRVAGHFKLPSMADLIAQKAQALTA